MFGHCGKILRVNLSSAEILVEKYTDDFARAFLGGNGFAAKLIYDHVPADADPYAEENAIVFAVGPLTDTPVWGTSRGQVAAISPQTGFFADSSYGGDFPYMQKRTGFDAIFISGKASQPVYLLVDETGAEIKNAAELWGLGTLEANSILQLKESAGAISASIGPAGENRVVFANIICGGTRAGAAGRAGMGAVMGSKKLKAVVVKGRGKTTLARADKLKLFLSENRARLKKNTADLSEAGTPALINVMNKRGLLCTHNDSRETFKYAADISADVLGEKYIAGKTACHGCPVACGKNVKLNSGEFGGQTVKMPEYETLCAFGSMLDNRDIESIINGNSLCDRLGMDTISMGVTIAFVAECMERGIVSAQAVGAEVRFANGTEMVELIKATAFRKGTGALLALGSSKLAEKFGGDAEKYLYAVKGLEIPGHSTRGSRELSLGYATATRGGSHQDTRPDYVSAYGETSEREICRYNIRSQHFTAVGDSLAMCRFTYERGLGTTVLNEDIATILNLVTGWHVDRDELERIGERIYNLERLINTRRGLTRKHDTLPYRSMNEPIPKGPAKGRHTTEEQLARLLDLYYSARGWTKNGIPSAEKLEQLGLI